jgi:sigma-B regulation protein RsbU (phosphoserine phosphatase)
MIKIAMQSVVRFAHDPGEVLRSLNRILSPELRGQLISAAYLWTDTESGLASYSAAGHPPLLYWKSAKGELERIDSNGLLFGVTPDSDYPVVTLPLRTGDRFLIHTDGLAEAENLAGESFGDRQLEKVVREHRSLSASDLLQRLLFELQIWHLPNTPQQDDITLIVMDVLESSCVAYTIMP